MGVPGRLLALGAVAASALAFGLYSRMEWPWLVLGWFGLVPWLAVLDRTRSLRGALVAGLVMACAFELTVFGWFARAIETYTDAPWIVGAALLLVFAPLLQPQFIPFAVARHLAHAGDRSRTWIAALVGAGTYVGIEWAIPKLFADTLGHGLYPSLWMRQAADLGGAHGLTFVLIIANECVLAIVRIAASRAPLRARMSRARAPIAVTAGLVAGLVGYGIVRCDTFGGGDQPLAAHGPREAGGSSEPAPGTSEANGRGIVAGLVQASISHYDRLRAEIGTHAAVRQILDAHFTLSADMLRRAPLDLLVWPETVYPTTFGAPKSEEGAAFDREIASFVADTGVPLIFGSYDAEGGEEFNAAMFLAVPEDGRLVFDTYRKAALFPLTERVPAFLDSDVVRGWLPWLGTWKRGAGAEVVSMTLRDGRPIRIAPLICYDVLDPRLVLAAVGRGAELIVTLSNDSWFAEGRGPRMHLVGAAFLSIETRRPQVRATNTGISAIIDATGTLVTTAAVGDRATLVARVLPAADSPTLMVRWGEWFGPVALAASALLGAFGAIGRRRRASRR